MFVEKMACMGSEAARTHHGRVTTQPVKTIPHRTRFSVARREQHTVARRENAHASKGTRDTRTHEIPATPNAI